MSLLRTRQFPINAPGRKSDMRTQFAALPWRVRDGKVQVLLVTSRGTGRWIVPKGWPMDGRTPAEAAAAEAWEEAGVEGRADDFCLGLYTYIKDMPSTPDLPVAVALFPLEVRRTRRDFPEAGERKPRWFSRKKAAGKVAEPELAAIIRGFDPRALRR
ncbi:8-oxo-dGTP pyrophosphatase MutT (NUDIX family) [Hasllibacter halocynthiae]|uniref:8-oxo-dGTP pyrophosphatase MutT (NUDIX family) n=1 Tax=Hasllibacter halocynthiae TaxID=595589 RepID=A0A2T0X660_9RHOB|nr:NUDIX hydrolase [Hasllibacter halocynthiae]PRY94440.1 8-oxo-dGTP pyrophosphatase MutT (NUDIX family) [Hasllibacter halocynthiae]